MVLARERDWDQQVGFGVLLGRTARRLTVRVQRSARLANREDGNAAPAAVLRCVESLATESVRDEVMVLVPAGPAGPLGPLRAYGVLDDFGGEDVAGLGLLWIAATRSKAVRSDGGNDLPRLPARRKIPAQAFALKKYRSGSLPRSSKSNNEDAAAALGHSEVLSVQNSVSGPIPELSQGPEDGSKRPSGVDRQHTRDVLPDNPPRSQALNSAEKFQREVATRVIHSKPVAGDAKGLAGSSSDEKLNWSCSDAPEPMPPDRREIAKVPYLRIAVRQDRAREWIDLGEPRGGPAQAVPGNGGRFDARAHRPVGHDASVSTGRAKPRMTRASSTLRATPVIAPAAFHSMSRCVWSSVNCDDESLGRFTSISKWRPLMVP